MQSRNNSFPNYPTTGAWWNSSGYAAANVTNLTLYPQVPQIGAPPKAKKEPAREPTVREWLDAQIDETCALAGIAA